MTEWDEPQAVIGSYLHRYAYPDWFAAHEKRGRQLAEAHDHGTRRRGRLPAAARRVPVRRRGRGRHARLRRRQSSPTRASRSASSRRRSRRSATTRTSPRRTPPASRCRPTSRSHPSRNQGELMRVTNQEQPFHPIYNYAFVTDAEEGLILVDVNTLRRRRAAQQLPQARADLERGRRARRARATSRIGGHYALRRGRRGHRRRSTSTIRCSPKVAAIVPLAGRARDRAAVPLPVRRPTATGLQGRRRHRSRSAPRWSQSSARRRSRDAQRRLRRAHLRLCRGRRREGLVDRRRRARRSAAARTRRFTADGKLDDARDVVVGIDQRLAVRLRRGRAERAQGACSSPRPTASRSSTASAPSRSRELIACVPTAQPGARRCRKGLERDRGVDETGGPDRGVRPLGSRPFNLAGDAQAVPGCQRQAVVCHRPGAAEGDAGVTVWGMVPAPFWERRCRSLLLTSMLREPAGARHRAGHCRLQTHGRGELLDQRLPRQAGAADR